MERGLVCVRCVETLLGWCFRVRWRRGHFEPPSEDSLCLVGDGGRALREEGNLSRLRFGCGMVMNFIAVALRYWSCCLLHLFLNGYRYEAFTPFSSNRPSHSTGLGCGWRRREVEGLMHAACKWLGINGRRWKRLLRYRTDYSSNKASVAWIKSLINPVKAHKIRH